VQSAAKNSKTQNKSEGEEETYLLTSQVEREMRIEIMMLKKTLKISQRKKFQMQK
jgi:hypothetical protein